MTGASARPAPLLGVVGGTGLYAMDQLQGVEEQWIDTPFGRHSVQTVRGAGYRLAADGG